MILAVIFDYGLLFLEILFNGSTDLRSRAMEEHPLVGLGNTEEVTDFLRHPPLDVTQDDLVSMTRARQENVKSNVKNGESLPIGLQCCHGKRFGEGGNGGV